MNRWKKSRDNRGMSLVMVIGTVALVSILVVIVLSLSLMNIQMKSVYKSLRIISMMQKQQWMRYVPVCSRM